MVLNQSCIWKKLNHIELAVENSLNGKGEPIPFVPARDIEILIPGQLTPKKGLSSKEGQARLLHDLASIELQAMELGLRTLTEFTDAPEGFRAELAAITLSEAKHLRLCLQGMEKLGFKWGDWAAHTMLWSATAAEDSLLDRVLIVHRYLEGSGLDAGDTLLKRLGGVLDSPLQSISKIILTEEIEHVEFGSRWYRELCKQEKIDPQEDFANRMEALRWRMPKRIEKISRQYRAQAGFTNFELDYLENLRNEICKHQHQPQNH
ncbi:MAG: DUF455 family protein [Bdellovibrionales bacterium]|nr:DUF455 family protein [Bdellovibrionales bacterium]